MKTITFLGAAVIVAALGSGARADLAPPRQPPPASTRDLCMDAVAKDPRLAKDVGDAALGVDEAAKQRAALDKEAGERRSVQDKETREQTTRQIALDERQVILAYAALWVIAAGFVVFLWRKQGVLKAEIASLRRELADAAKDAK
jgi:hypothetical protein